MSGMNNQDQFEHKLRSQAFRAVPPQWRGEILGAARSEMGEETTAGTQPCQQRSLLEGLRALLWPHPVAWAGLASIWLLIAGLNLSLSDQPLGVASAPMAEAQPPELRKLLAEQDRLLAELLGESALPMQPVDARPRSSRISRFTYV